MVLTLVVVALSAKLLLDGQVSSYSFFGRKCGWRFYTEGTIANLQRMGINTYGKRIITLIFLRILAK